MRKLSEIKQEMLQQIIINTVVESGTGGGSIEHYNRSNNWSIVDKTTIKTPNRITTNINGNQYNIANDISIDINTETYWDDNQYSVPLNRKGKDFYIYHTNDNQIVLSANSTFPNDFTSENTRKIGGFHCLCEDVGTITNHTLSDYITGDILPQSIWDIIHKPIANPEGMVYNPNINRWIDIYLAGINDNKLVSKYDIPHVTGETTEKFHWYKFSHWFGLVGKRMLNQHEFQNSSLGSNQGTNITGSVNPITTGGYVDTAGRRMISNIGCESMCGVLWQWGEQKGTGTGAAWTNAFDGNDSLDVRGQHYLAPNVPLFGGRWSNGTYCGSRSSYWNHSPLHLGASNGSRGSSEPMVRGHD